MPWFLENQMEDAKGQDFARTFLVNCGRLPEDVASVVDHSFGQHLHLVTAIRTGHKSIRVNFNFTKLINQTFLKKEQIISPEQNKRKEISTD